MKTLDELQRMAEAENIPVVDKYIHSETVGAMSVCDDDGDCIIAIDESKVSSSADRKVKMAHELGHCVQAAFCNRHSTLDNIGKHEYKADKWAAQQIIPYDEMITACKQGCTEAWQLAERFDVTEDFVRRSFQIYVQMGYTM